MSRVLQEEDPHLLEEDRLHLQNALQDPLLQEEDLHHLEEEALRQEEEAPLLEEDRLLQEEEEEETLQGIYFFNLLNTICRRREGPYYRPPPRVQGNERDRRNSTTLFVGNLPYHFRERDVGEYFERAGRVRSIKVGLNYRTGESKGYCFVEFETRRDAEDAFDR